jgi:sugar phosphate isomerase/epimerase
MKSAIVVAVEPDVKPLGLAGDFKKNVNFIAELGFDGAELSVMHVDRLDVAMIRETVLGCGLEIPAVGSGRYYLQHGLSLSTNDTARRQMAVDAVIGSLEVVRALESQFIIGVAQGKNETSQKQGLICLKDSLGRCAERAEKLGITLLLEPIHRYQITTINSLQQGIDVIESVGSRSIKLLADTHHMNIEERSLAQSLLEAGENLGHMHFSDSNRLAPGWGHINFHEISETLKEIGYTGFASAEILTEPDQSAAARQTKKLINALPY